MNFVMRRGPILLLAAALTIAALGAWWISRDALPDTEPAPDLDRSKEPSHPPRLRGLAPESEGSASTALGESAERGGTDSEPPPSNAQGAPARKVTFTMRVVDRDRRPLAYARIALRVAGPRGEVTCRGKTDAHGNARIARPPGTVIGVTVDAPGLRGPLRVLERKDSAGVDLRGLEEVRAENLVLLPVRTVDSRGEARAEQRVLFRPREEDGPTSGWNGATSDSEGWCRLGPFAPDTRVEVRAGPRGLSYSEIADPAGWIAVRVDGSPLEIVVGDVPKLSLDFSKVDPDLRLPITVRDAEISTTVFPPRTHRAGDGIWTAPALPDDRLFDVLVGPVADGRFTRYAGVVPQADPIVVELGPGFSLEGRVTHSELGDSVEGTVRAVGRGFSVSTSVGSDGRFRFPGLPDEELVLVASARLAAGEPPLAGRAARHAESYVEVPLVPAIRVGGRLTAPGPDGEETLGVSLLLVLARSPDLPAPLRQETAGNRFGLLLHPGRWRLVVTAVEPAGRTLHGEIDLGEAKQHRTDIVVVMQEQ